MKREKVIEVIELLEQDYTVIGACRQVGVHNSSFYEFLKTDDELRERHQAIPEFRKSRMRSHAFNRALASNDSDKPVRWLERRDDEFKPKLQHQFEQAVIEGFAGGIQKVLDDVDRERMEASGQDAEAVSE